MDDEPDAEAAALAVVVLLPPPPEVNESGSIIAEAIFTAATAAARPTTSAANGPVNTAREAARVKRHNSIAFRRTQKIQSRMKIWKKGHLKHPPL